MCPSPQHPFLPAKSDSKADRRRGGSERENLGTHEYYGGFLLYIPNDTFEFLAVFSVKLSLKGNHGYNLWYRHRLHFQYSDCHYLLAGICFLRLQPINDRVYFPKWYLRGMRGKPIFRRCGCLQVC